jgi:hypothetical protein
MTSDERAIRQRKEFLEVDQFALRNAEVFRKALLSLQPGICTWDIDLDEVLSFYEAKIRTGECRERGFIETASAGCGALIWTVYSHLACGTPLFFNDWVLLAWFHGDGTSCQCQACGYRWPKPWARCTICNGPIGRPGEWEKRRETTGAVN